MLTNQTLVLQVRLHHSEEVRDRTEGAKEEEEEEEEKGGEGKGMGHRGRGRGKWRGRWDAEERGRA